MRIPFPVEAKDLGIEPSALNLREYKLSRWHQAYRGNLELSDVRRRQSKPCAPCRYEAIGGFDAVDRCRACTRKKRIHAETGLCLPCYQRAHAPQAPPPSAGPCRHRANGQKRFYVTNLVAIGFEYGVHGHYNSGRLQPVHRGRIAATNGVCEATVSRQMGEVSRAGALTRRRSMAKPNRYDFAFDASRMAWCVVDLQANESVVAHAWRKHRAEKQARDQDRTHQSQGRFVARWQELPEDEAHAPTIEEIQANEKLAALYDFDPKLWKRYGTTRSLDGYAHVPRWMLSLVKRPSHKAVLVVYLLRGLLQLRNGRLVDRIERIPQEQVAYAAGVSVRTVRRCNAVLERTGMFRIVAHRGIQKDPKTGEVVYSEPQTVIYLPLEKANHEAIQLRARVTRIRARIGAQALQWRKALETMFREAGVAESADLAMLEANCAVFQRNAIDAGIPITAVDDVLARPPDRHAAVAAD